MKKLLLILAVCLVGCSRNITDITSCDSFMASDSLNSIAREISSDILYPRSLFICNGNLIILNEKVDTLFRVFNLPDFTYKFSFGIKGQGPDDFFLPFPQAINFRTKTISLLDVKTIKDISFIDGKPVIQSKVIPAPFDYFNGLIQLKNSLYCCDAGLEEEKELMFLYLDGTFTKKGDYPENEERFETKLSRNQAYKSIKIAKPDGEKFASFYCYLRRFRIYNASGDILHDVLLDIQPSEKVLNEVYEKRYLHPIAAYATEQCIYTLNLDMTEDEIIEKTRYPNIQVFSWEGKPLKKYDLDVFINAFIVDESASKLYGVFVEDDNHIYEFNLK
ncbi:BF3164 family lipoprotein [Bacteroides thetaiotaomicron]|uniref:BF3164 family lipoprotein n=1 Tax=Bacteroides thetaiotaomicron TaxID=818 RepID=UPI0039B655BA